ncbi:MAG: ThiF family adenylyltransferase [Cyanobacteria bacterium HKST-UBA03]|nr:ThiF family adenylyltransferase [Cyanobacteria bacterium HKST-UBA03]
MSLPPDLSAEEQAFYNRQMRLPEVQEEGQRRLKHSRVLIVGLGGLGCPALQYLAAAGVGVIGLCDGDQVDTSNLHRQPLYHPEQVGQPKVAHALEAAQRQNPYITIQTHPYPITADNSVALFSEYDLVLDCTDNYATKFLLNDTAVLTQTPIIQASIYQAEGQLWLYNPAQKGPCLRCIWPDIPEPDCVGTCAEVGVLGVVPGTFGLLQAAEALKYLLGISSPLANGPMLLLNVNDYSQSMLGRPRDTDCPVCGTHPAITAITATAYAQTRPWEKTVDALREGQPGPMVWVWVDIRDPEEVAADPMPDSPDAMPGGIRLMQCPMGVVEADPAAMLPKDAPILLICQRGVRSRKLAHKLRQEGFGQVFSLVGGIDALKRQPSFM